MQLYDMHSHILPGFDDGARTIKDSLELLECLKKQGIRNVCLTPHFYTNEKSLYDFVTGRNEAFERFKPYIPVDMNIILGAEVYVTKYLFGNDVISDIFYGKSRYILTEFAYNATFEGSSMDMLENLINRHGCIPVLPHVERYRFLIDNPAVIDELRKLGVIIQTNISNYAKNAPILRRRKMLKLIASGRIDIIGSDTHSFTHNTPTVYAEALECIDKKCGAGTVSRLMKNCAKIFNASF